MSAQAQIPRAPFALPLRSLRVLWRMLLPLVIAANIVLWPRLLGASEALQAQALRVALIVLVFTLVLALLNEVLSPVQARLRLVPFSDARARRLAAIARGLLFVLLGTEVAIYLGRANDWNEAVASLLGLLRTCGLIVLGAMLAGRLGWLRRLRGEPGPSQLARIRGLLVRVVFPLAVLALLFFVIARALGYLGLARWVVTNAAWTAAALMALVMLYRALQRRMREGMHSLHEAMLEDAAERAPQVPTEEGTEPAPVSPHVVGGERLLGAGLVLLTLVGAVLLLMSIWEVDASTLSRWGQVQLLGGAGPTLGMLAGGVLAMGVTFLFGALLRNLLIFFVFPRADVEVGARYAILTILRYLVWIFALYFLMRSLGIDTSAFAVFAGAFGVGLAFGLQDIFANFFSGLIMLLERPVRVGDLVEVGATSGQVEAIRLRGTTIRTFDRTTVTIPNREMIGERLTNLTYGMSTARVVVGVGVSYGSDLSKVEDVLLDVAAGDGRVLDDPGPFVRVEGFGDNSVDFVLRCFTDQVTDRWAIKSDLHRAIFAAFARAGIEIPFPQRDVHLIQPPSGSSDSV